VPKIFVNGQSYYNLSSKTWSHVFFLEHNVELVNTGVENVAKTQKS